MGFGNYSHDAHEALIARRAAIPAQQVFSQQHIHPLMNPKDVRARESRDAPAHPSSLGIVFALDVTGSMGAIPRILATEQLPKFMKVLEGCKVPDPQLLFMAVGDATSDRAPLQVGQFESTAELMDQWLTWSFLEGGGGGGGRESYELALYFLAQHTEMDCWVKRKKRGYLFMTGDELPYPTLSKHIVESIVGDRIDDDLKLEEIVAELQKTYVPFFVIPDQDRRQRCERRWREVFGENVICMKSPHDICFVTAGALLISEGLVKDVDSMVSTLLGAGLGKARTGAVVSALEGLADLHGLGGRGGLRKFLAELAP